MPPATAMPTAYGPSSTCSRSWTKFGACCWVPVMMWQLPPIRFWTKSARGPIPIFEQFPRGPDGLFKGREGTGNSGLADSESALAAWKEAPGLVAG